VIRVVAIGEVAEVNPRVPAALRKDANRVVSFVPMAELSEQGYLRDPLERRLDDVVKGHTYFERGDILLAKITPCLENGKATLTGDLPHDIGFGSTEFHVLRAGPSVDRRYLFYMVWSPQFRFVAGRNMTGTAGQKRVPADFVRRFQIPLPDLHEQQRIGRILDTAAGALRVQSETGCVVETLRQSAFRRMFGDPIANERAWVTEALGGVASNVRYGTSTKCVVGGGGSSLPVLRIPNILSGEVIRDDMKFARLDASEIEKLMLREGDILFVRTNGNPAYIGRCAVYPGGEPTVFASYLLRVRLREDAGYLPRFLQELVSFPTFRQRIMAEARTTAGNYNISSRRLRALELIAPPRELQEEFLGALDRIENVRALASAQTEKMGELLSELLRRAFAGEL